MILQRTVCDTCYAENKVNDAIVERTVSLNKTIGILELCEDCDTLLSKVLSPYFRVARKPDRERRASTAPSGTVPDGDGVVHCTDPDCDRTFKTESGMHRHHTRMHEQSVAA